MDLFLFFIPFKGEERPAKTKLTPAKLPRSVSQLRVRLRAVLVSAESDSAQCSQFWILEIFSSNQRVGGP